MMDTVEMAAVEMASVVAALRADGRATIEVSDTVRVEVRFGPDELTYPDDYINTETEGWGRVARVDFECTRGRPEGFDGCAMKLYSDRWGDWWWQPPLDLMGLTVAVWTAPESARRRDEERDALCRILQEGLFVMSATVETRCACCGHWSAGVGSSLGAIEPVKWHAWDEHLESILTDLLVDLDLTL